MKILLTIKFMLILLIAGFDPIQQTVLGSLSWPQVVAFYFFSNFGMLFTLVIHYRIGRNQNRKKSNYSKFDLRYWLKDNWARIVSNQMAVFIVLRFWEKFTSIEFDLFYGFVIGLGIDTVIILIRKFTPVNIFQTPNK